MKEDIWITYNKKKPMCDNCGERPSSGTVHFADTYSGHLKGLAGFDAHLCGDCEKRFDFWFATTLGAILAKEKRNKL